MNYKNQYGITIKQCCASCVNCKLVGLDKHRCTAKNEETLPQFVCTEWKIKPKLMNAGMGTGTVRDKAEMAATQSQRVESGELRINMSAMKRIAETGVGM